MNKPSPGIFSDKASILRGHTYWEPMWKGGLIGITFGGALAFVLSILGLLIFEQLDGGSMAPKEKLITVGLSCLWGSGWATYWWAHRHGREFGWSDPAGIAAVEERKFEEELWQEYYDVWRRGRQHDSAVTTANAYTKEAMEHRRKMIRDGEAGVTSWRMTAETFLLQKAQNAKLTAENTRLKKKLATLRT